MNSPDDIAWDPSQRKDDDEDDEEIGSFTPQCRKQRGADEEDDEEIDSSTAPQQVARSTSRSRLSPERT